MPVLVRDRSSEKMREILHHKLQRVKTRRGIWEAILRRNNCTIYGYVFRALYLGCWGRVLQLHVNQDTGNHYQMHFLSCWDKLRVRWLKGRYEVRAHSLFFEQVLWWTVCSCSIRTMSCGYSSSRRFARHHRCAVSGMGFRFKPTLAGRVSPVRSLRCTCTVGRALSPLDE